MLAILTALAVAMPQAQDFSWSGTLRADQRVSVHNIIGDVRVERATGGRAEVVATKRAGRYGRPEDVTVTAEESSRGVLICVRYPGSEESRRGNDEDDCSGHGTGNGRRNRNDTEVNFVIRLPVGVEVEAATVSGNVIARDLGADATVTSVSGDVTVEGFAGGDLEATTVSGDVELRGIRGRQVSAETVSGDVSFAGTLARDGEYSFSTLSGTVLVDLPSGSGAEVSASTFSGQLRMPEGMVSESSNRRRSRASGRIGSGGPSLHVESFSGSVEVRVGSAR